jgi:Tfp pilus assembly protein PilF
MRCQNVRVRVRRHAALYVIACVLSAAVLPAAWAAEGEVGKIAAVQNQVETKAAAAGDWEPSVLHSMLHARDRVRTGAESRAAILYSDQTLHRINEKSEVEVLPPEAGNPGLLKVISGNHFFSSRKPKDFGRVETPTVTAAIRGTEFVVDVGDRGVTTITMIEGVVDASNTFGSVQVGAGEQAFIEPGKAPVKRIVVRPRDAVAWSLYYPRVLGGSDAQRLESMGAGGRDLARAAELLSSGQVGQARPLIESARERDPDNPVALALASVIGVVSDRKDEAYALARQAVEADSDSGAAALALSLALQSRFEIDQALEMAETAARLDPDSAEALARVAELRLATGDTRGAQDAAERAVRRDANSARALTVLGFVQLAQLKSAEALGTFERAVQTDPSFPLARLGLGIARIRGGDLKAGREEMQTAVLLDPDNSLFRSYLAKAYYEELREDAAAKEIAAAKELDPSDPTPYLYSALQKQTYNRQVEALHELQESIARNDNRAVYRSRLLLDEDLAVRSANLASIYSELGFSELGMVTARRSADADQSNFSSHLFLAESYRTTPGFAPAFLSEVLQARIYQPVNVNAVRPDVVNETASFNEYTSLINRPRIRGFAGITYGATSTDLADLELPPAFQDLLELDSSNPSGGDVTFTFNRDRVAGSLSYTNVSVDGFRTNTDISQDNIRGFFVFAPTHRDQIQLNFISGSRETGDLPLRENPFQVAPERFETDLSNVGVGYHRIISPASDLAVSAIYSDTEQTAFDFNVLDGSSTPRAIGRFKGPQVEAQYVLRQSALTWTAGLGHFDGDQELESVSGSTTLSGDDQFTNAYVYAKLRNLGPVEITAGVAYEDLLAPVGLIPPRDYLIGATDLEYEDSQVTGKFGLSAYATPKTVVRATAYSRLTPAIGRLQTLEPTQVSGFNQFFDDPGGTSSFNYGIGLDQEFTRSFFAGFSVLRRDLDIPEAVCDSPDPAIGCNLRPATGIEQRNSDDWLANVYLNGTAGRRVSLGLQYSYEERDFDFTQVDQIGRFEDYQRTHRVRPEVRYFLPFGLFGVVRSTYYDQEIDKVDAYSDLTSPDRIQDAADFWVTDFQIGYRLPKRWGSVNLNVFNVTNEQFLLYRTSLEESVVPARTATLTVNFTSH